VLKNEISPLLKYFSKGDIKKYIQKVQKGLGDEIRGTKMPNTKLVKVYMTGKAAAGRMIVLVYIKQDYYIPVIVRLKKDKIIGSNLSSKNQAFHSLLEKNLKEVKKDLKNRDFEELK